MIAWLSAQTACLDDNALTARARLNDRPNR